MKFLIAMAIVCALLLFGCIGQAPAQQQAAGNGQQAGNNQPSGGQTTPGQTTAASGNDTNGSNAMDRLLSSIGLTTGWKVAYLISSSATNSTTQFTQYMDSSGKSRVDIASKGVETRSFVLGNTIYSCVNQGGWVCYSLPGVRANDTAYQLANDIKANPSKYTVTEDGSMQIAGTTATCYRVASVDGVVRYCISPEGVPLYIKTIGQAPGGSGDTELKATGYTPSVPDSDFVPPAPPQDLPGIGGGSSGGSGGAGGNSSNSGGADSGGAGSNPADNGGSGSNGAGTLSGNCVDCSSLQGNARAECLAWCG